MILDMVHPLVVIVVQSLSPVRLFAALWTEVSQASLSFTISLSLLKLMSIESVMPYNHLILCHSFLLLPSVFPRIRACIIYHGSLLADWPKDEHMSLGWGLGKPLSSFLK